LKPWAEPDQLTRRLRLLITDKIDNFEIGIMCSDPWKECYLKVELIEPSTLITEGTYSNVVMLSANLRDTISLSLAIDLLTKHNIPRTHPIWSLNHSDLWQRN
jgi:hypothetical protein